MPVTMICDDLDAASSLAQPRGVMNLKNEAVLRIQDRESSGSQLSAV